VEDWSGARRRRKKNEETLKEAQADSRLSQAITPW